MFLESFVFNGTLFFYGYYYNFHHHLPISLYTKTFFALIPQGHLALMKQKVIDITLTSSVSYSICIFEYSQVQNIAPLTDTFDIILLNSENISDDF